MSRTRRYEIGVGVFVTGALGVLAWMALRVGAISAPGDTVDIDVVMTDAAGLGEGAVVSIAGVPVGRVSALRVDFDRARARVHLDPDAEVRADARFEVRARSMLGEKYLQVTPGTRDAPLLADGDEVAVATPQLEVDELVARLGPLIDAVEPAVVQEASRAFAEALRADPERPKRMLADAETSLHNLAVASEELPALATEARGTLAALRKTAQDAGPVLDKLEGDAERLDRILAAVPPERIPETLAELQAAVKEGRAVVQRLDGSAADLDELLKKANAVTPQDLRRLLREEGVLIRFREKQVE